MFIMTAVWQSKMLNTQLVMYVERRSSTSVIEGKNCNTNISQDKFCMTRTNSCWPCVFKKFFHAQLCSFWHLKNWRLRVLKSILLMERIKREDFLHLTWFNRLIQSLLELHHCFSFSAVLLVYIKIKKMLMNSFASAIKLKFIKTTKGCECRLT